MPRTKDQLMNQALGLRPEAVRFPRTPETEALEDYSFARLLKDVASKVWKDSREGLEGSSERLLESSDEELQEIALAGLGGMAKLGKVSRLIKGFGGKSGSMWSTEQAVEFGRKAPRSMESLLKAGRERQENIYRAIERKYKKTGSLEDLKLWQEQGYKRQLYREALQGMEGGGK